MIKEQQKVPAFSLPDQEDNMHSLSDYKGELVLLYFYPKDNTPGCTTQACNFRDRLNELKDHDVQVLGVSKDTVASHKKFAEKFDLNFPILADPELEVIKAYDVWVEKSMYGKKYMGISRDSFLIGKDGKLMKHYNKVSPSKHVDEVVKDLKSL